MAPDMSWSQRGATSRSFILAVTGAALALGGYVAWTLLRPDPYAVSERIARDARREVAAEVRDFQREMDALMQKRRRGDAENLAAEIDKRLGIALQGVEDVVDGARDRLMDLDIGIRTQRNRLDRIQARAAEAEEMIRELAQEAKEKAVSTPRGP